VDNMVYQIVNIPAGRSKSKRQFEIWKE